MEARDLQADLDELLRELDELAEAWLEHRAKGQKTEQLSTAIAQATRESRKLETKLRKTKNT